MVLGLNQAESRFRIRILIKMSRLYTLPVEEGWVGGGVLVAEVVPGGHAVQARVRLKQTNRLRKITKKEDVN